MNITLSIIYLLQSHSALKQSTTHRLSTIFHRIWQKIFSYLASTIRNRLYTLTQGSLPE